MIQRRHFLQGLAIATALNTRMLRASTTGYRWTLGAPVVSPEALLDGKPVRLLDPCIVRDQDRWHVFASANGGTVYFSAADFHSRPVTRELVKLPVDRCFVPQVFWFRPENRWHLIGMIPDKSGHFPEMAPCLCTNATIGDPHGWSMPVVLDVPPPDGAEQPIKSWNDFYVICDDQKAHLFATSRGRLWRSETNLTDYPQGWSKPALALEGDFLYACHVYRQFTTQGNGRFFLNITGSSADTKTKQRRQYQQSYIADRIEGPWQAEAATWEKPFAAPANLRTTDECWYGDLVHGEPLRLGNDERMILEQDITGFIFHGHLRDPKTGGVINKSDTIGLLEPDNLTP